ncbi:MAG: MarR family transcriptional regulator [Firmicutes bacterium]|nr:MarR family transcriptional regulator [Alicyclobacillaceae bacterium]MCL6497270.1 MarR family transcriptional regulator [Bacillota bacterium]
MSDDAAVWAIGQALEGWYQGLGRQFGPLSRSQRRVMKVLEGGRRVKIGELADLLALTTAGATRMVDKLEALGYVKRQRDPAEDQRFVHVVLTPAGQAALREADAVFRARVVRSVETLSREDRATLVELLAKLAAPAPELPAPSPDRGAIGE